MTTKRIFAIQGRDGILRVNCSHPDTYWVYDDTGAGAKFCRNCHRIVGYDDVKNHDNEIRQDG